MPVTRRINRQWIRIASGAWTPASLPNLVAWYDASDTATITHSSGAVSQWDDKSGNGRHLTQATGSQQPTTGTRTINSLNVIDFDGSADRMSATFPVTSQPFTFLMVYASDVAGDERVLDAGGDGSTRALYDASWTGDANKRLMYASATSAVGTTGGTNVEQFVALFNGASSEGWLNNVSNITGNPGSNGLTATMYVGSDNASSHFDGRIAELAVMSSGISSADRSSWTTYCARWGL